MAMLLLGGRERECQVVCANVSFTLQTEKARAIGGCHSRLGPKVARIPVRGTPGWAADSMGVNINGESPELSPPHGSLHPLACEPSG
jgi:hypothetical protein